MAAPRKYSDSQRQELFRLYEAGKSPTEIACICGEGTAGVDPFRIPRRTVHDIVTAMARDTERDLPESIDDEGILEAVGRFPERIAQMVNDELERLEARQKNSGLKPEDFARLRSAHDLSAALSKRAKRAPAATPRVAGKAGRQERPESAIERLAREEGERPREKPQLSRTRTSPLPVDPPPDEPVPDVGTTSVPRPKTPEEAVRQVAAKYGVDLGEIEDGPALTRASREESRRRARVALGYGPG